MILVERYEIQNVKEVNNPWIDDGNEKIGFVDVLLGLMKIKNADVYVTGSNSKMLSSDIVTQFRDRGDEIRLYPLSYKEIFATGSGNIGLRNARLNFRQQEDKKPEKQSRIEKTEETFDFAPVPEGVKVPKTMAWKYNEIAKIISDFADEKLNDEYKELSLRALAVPLI